MKARLYKVRTSRLISAPVNYFDGATSKVRNIEAPELYIPLLAHVQFEGVPHFASAAQIDSQRLMHVPIPSYRAGNETTMSSTLRLTASAVCAGVRRGRSVLGNAATKTRDGCRPPVCVNVSRGPWRRGGRPGRD